MGRPRASGTTVALAPPSPPASGGYFHRLFPFNVGRVGARFARRPAMRPLSDSEDSFGWLLLAWEELCEEVGLSGLPRSPDETPLEWARRAGDN